MIKRCPIYIGIGGTGGQMLIELRRVSAASGMPPQGEETRYLYLDTSADVVGTPDWQQWAGDIPFLNLKEEARSLNEMEQNPELRDCVGGMRWQLAERLHVPVYEVEQALSRTNGAGGMRRYARALFLQSWPAVQRILTPLTEGVEQLEFHVFFSAGGGTGSGCAPDLLYRLEKICLRKPGSILLPYAFFSAETTPTQQRLAAELADWLELADEDLLPHCYLSTPVADLPAQVQTLARALTCARHYFYIGGEYYDHLYDSIRPRGTTPADRFASLGYATGPADTPAWLAGMHSMVTLCGEGKGPRNVLIIALPRSAEDPRALEIAIEDALEDAPPCRLSDTAFCSLAPGDAAQALLLQTGIAPARCALLQQFATASIDEEDYFAARSDRD